MEYLSSVRLSVLVQITKCPAYMVTKATTDDNGFETARLLRDHFGRAKRQMAISTSVRIVLHEFGGSRFIQQLARWELDISKYERVTTEHLVDLLQTTVHR